MFQFNAIAVMAAAAVYFAAGALWYLAFGRHWVRLTPKSDPDVAQGGGASYVVGAVSAILPAAAIEYLARSTGSETLGHYLLLALLLWAGIAAATAAKHYAFMGLSGLLFLIDYGYDLIGFLIMASILWLWP